MLFLSLFFARQTFNLGSRNWAKESLENPAEFSCWLGSVNISVAVQLSISCSSQLYPSYLLIWTARSLASCASAQWLGESARNSWQRANQKTGYKVVAQSEVSVHGLPRLLAWQRLTQLQNRLDSLWEKTRQILETFSPKIHFEFIDFTDS